MAIKSFSPNMGIRPVRPLWSCTAVLVHNQNRNKSKAMISLPTTLLLSTSGGVAKVSRVSGLLLSSIFLATPEDETWSFSAAGGVERLFPDVWAQRLAFLESFQVSPAQAPSMLLSKLETGTQEEKKAIAAGVMNWEGNLMNAQADISYLEPDELDDSDVASTQIFLHFEAHQFFLEPNQLLKNTAAIAQVPTIIVHGRYDALCPVDSAWELHQQVPHSQLLILPSSNHRLTAEGEIARKLAFRQFLFEHVQ